MMTHAGSPPAGPVSRPSPWRAWWFLFSMCLVRQAKLKQMVWIALALLAFTATVVGLNTAGGRWSMNHWRQPYGPGMTYQERLETAQVYTLAGNLYYPLQATASEGILLACHAVIQDSGFLVFSRWVVYSVFLSFLLPIWSLSFATEAIGGEREARTLVWLFTRPVSRTSIYLAKFAALLPWALGLNLGGFALICLAAGEPGRAAFLLYWPPVIGATLAFCSLFHLLSACIRHSAVVGIVYVFFLEALLGNMPGYLKRVSISFYARCLMFDAAESVGVSPPEKSSIYLPVDPTTAWSVLAGVTVVLLLAGIWVFNRLEYRDES